VLIDPTPGTMLRAVVSKDVTYQQRCPCGPGSCAVYPPCTVKFTGWAGACTGLGTPVTDTQGHLAGYECRFVYSGNDTLGATWQFEVGELLGQTTCVAVGAATSTTLPGATTTTLPSGDPLADAMNRLADALLTKAVANGIRRFGLGFVARANGVPPSKIHGLVTGQAGGRQARIGPARAGGAVLLAKGGTHVGRSGAALLGLTPTRRARKLRRSTAPLPIVIAVTGRSAGRTATATRMTVLLP
jgi:hypothetical protein